MNARQRVPRRSLLLGTLAVAGCAGPVPTPEPPASGSPSSPSTSIAPTASTAPTPGPSTPTMTAPPEPQLPSSSEIIDRYAGRTPAQWGTEVAGVVSTLDDIPGVTSVGRPRVALTFDACGGGGAGDGFDADLIGVLREHRVPATLFLNARWIGVHPGLAADLATDPLFAVACHGTRHVPLSVTGASAYGIAGTGSVEEVYAELTGNIDWFVEHTGAPPRYSRPGTAHCDEVAAAIAQDLGMPIAGFSVNGDGGATFGAAQVRDTLAGVRDGDIVLAHMNRPGGGTARGCAQALPPLLDRGVEFVTL